MELNQGTWKTWFKEMLLDHVTHFLNEVETAQDDDEEDELEDKTPLTTDNIEQDKEISKLEQIGRKKQLIFFPPEV